MNHLPARAQSNINKFVPWMKNPLIASTISKNILGFQGTIQNTRQNYESYSTKL